MTKNHNYPVVLAGAFLMALLTITSCTTNWPQFRGPDQNMVATGKNLPQVWNDSTNIRWTAEMKGDSWASPVVWGNKVFVTSALRVKEDTSYLQDIYRWEVTCIDVNTGEVLWNQVAREGNPRIKIHRAHNYAGESPVTDGKRLYVYFGMTGVYCYDLEGNLIWEKDLGAYETLNGWGTGASPVVYDGKLYIQVDNEEKSFLVALNSESGEEIWRATRDEKTNYSTPFIWNNSMRTELVAGGKRAISYDPLTGDILWELQVDGYYNIPSPVAGEDVLYLGNTAWRETPGTYFCIKAGAEGDISPAEGQTTSKGLVWSNPDAPADNPSLLLHDGLLYQISSRSGTVTCTDAITGEQIYQEKIEKVASCWASPWVFEGKIHFNDEKGVTRVFKAGKDFELLHENALDDKFWTSVAVAGDAYLLRGAKKLYCIGL
jgi:outer membrane protein assembly factor BamB